MPSYSDLLHRLPYRLRLRFDSLSAYVRAIIDEEESELPRRLRLQPQDVQLIQLIVFIRSLDAFFRDGSAAARSAVRGFERLGVSGFSVGSTHFEGDNENVRLGDDLARSLRETIPELERLDDEHAPSGLRELTLYLIRRIRRG